jgi:hypothetical protein
MADWKARLIHGTVEKTICDTTGWWFREDLSTNMRELYDSVCTAVAEVREMHARPGFEPRPDDMGLADAAYFLKGPFPHHKLEAILNGSAECTKSDVRVYQSWVLNACFMSQKHRVWCTGPTHFVKMLAWEYHFRTYFDHRECGVFKLRHKTIDDAGYWAVVTKRRTRHNETEFTWRKEGTRVRQVWSASVIIEKSLSLELIVTRIQRTWRHWCKKKRAARMVLHRFSDAIVNPRTPLGKRRLLRDYEELSHVSKICKL